MNVESTILVDIAMEQAVNDYVEINGASVPAIIRSIMNNQEMQLRDIIPDDESWVPRRPWGVEYCEHILNAIIQSTESYIEFYYALEKKVNEVTQQNTVN